MKYVMESNTEERKLPKLNFNLKSAITNFNMKIANKKKSGKILSPNLNLNNEVFGSFPLNNNLRVSFSENKLNFKRTQSDLLFKMNLKKIKESPKSKHHIRKYIQQKYKSAENNIKMNSTMPSFRQNAYALPKDPMKPYQNPATTFYSSMSKKQNQQIKELIKQISEELCLDREKMPVFNNEALGTMKEFFKKNPKTSFLSKKANDEKPFIFPIMNVHDAEYSSISQKNRFEKNYQTLLNLRCRITSDKDHSREYLKEFLNKLGIYDKEYFTEDNSKLFLEFLMREPLQIDKTMSLKEIIRKVMNIVQESKVEPQQPLKQDTTMSQFKVMKGVQTGTNSNFFPSLKKGNNSSRQIPLITIKKKQKKDFYDIRTSLLAAKSWDTKNTRSLCSSLESEFKDIGFFEEQPKPAKRIYLNNNSEIINPVSTLEKDQFEAQQYDKFKRKNKLLELILWKRSKNELMIEEEKSKMKIQTLLKD